MERSSVPPSGAPAGADGWRVIAPDTPGYGLSDRPSARPAIDDYADNLAVVFDSLDVPDAVIAGHHTGALIAAAFAASRPARTSGLILDNPPFYTVAERTQRVAQRHSAHQPCEGGEHFTSRWRFLRSDGVSPLRVSTRIGSPISSIGAMRLRWTSCASAFSGLT